ncbi:hypothetical protein R7Z46_02090 [Mesomycoplasma ovipneumoniae]|uniref:hypothetical protein n=1 Tax=Mesomycoplasma ovipneumoniae TaxID=29562 RepID=UPI002963FDEF|nr:hypothetical protein [Mesomycoplasma ovipneumoniae]MDW2915699.1 hypothetical protein [Mesomycoplasma ovipneumoniae]
MSFNNKKYLFLAPLIVLPWIFPAIIFALQNKNNNLFTISINDNESLKSKISSNNNLFTISINDSQTLKSNIFSYYDLVRMDKKETIWLKNSHWMPIFLSDNEKIQEIIKKYLYFESDNFKTYNAKEFDKLSAFFSKEYDKATTQGENFQKLSGNWSFVDYKKIFTKIFLLSMVLISIRNFLKNPLPKNPF